MVDDGKLAGLLSDFARNLATEFSIQIILDHLVKSVVDVLPVTGAGVTLISEKTAPHYVAASSPAALRFEKLQTELSQGPCELAYTTGEAVSVPDLALDELFPVFSPAALAEGLHAAFTFPLRAVEGRLGALDLYRDEAGGLDESDLIAAQTLADVAAAYLLNARGREEARAASDSFRHVALHDQLTGLPNRVLLQQRLAHAAKRAKRSKRSVAVLFADLDQFKVVNDTYGHQVGDQLLSAVAHRLSAVVRPGDTLARIFGDEFVVLCEDLVEDSDVEILAERLGSCFDEPFSIGAASIRVSASIGMAFAGPGVKVSERLIDQADSAMYEAKRAGKAQRVIDLRESLLQEASSGSLEADLARAVAAEELSVAYQPIVETSTGVVTGVEALVRWEHPERGAISAVSIIEAAESLGLIGEVGMWVLERACLAHREWRREYPDRPLDLAVNVSGTQLLAPGFAKAVAETLARTGMNTSDLVLEMTESILIADSDATLQVLLELNRLGIRLALDDFGTGYSSLSYLHRLPIAALKIDQGFVADIGHTPSGDTIVAAVTALAHALGLSVIAEGVETRAQWDRVNEIGCELAQGFFFARPVPAEDIHRFLGEQGHSALHLPQRRNTFVPQRGSAHTPKAGLPLA
jgi:diguanylate cyclase (GGDEF)-like protein